MLNLYGSVKRLCNGGTRRDILQLGGLSLFGFGLHDALRLQPLQAANAPNRPAPAKACILVYLFGAPAQHETFDPKPNSPAEIQGEMKAIQTCIPGSLIGEGLPKLARILDRVTVIRSLTHPFPFHHVHYAVTGIPDASKVTEADPNDRSLWPFIGSLVDFLSEKRTPASEPVPRNIALPFRIYSKVNFRLLGGPYAGFLGSRYDPIWTEFSAKGTRPVPNQAGKPDLFDPYGGIRPADRFELIGTSDQPAAMTPNRVGLRRSLLEQFEHARRLLDKRAPEQDFDRFRDMAWSLLTSPRVAQALDVGMEPMAVRERYGMTLFGQSLLASRRLVEAGCKFVTAIWDAYGHFADGWDTHHYHYKRLREFLLPGFDESFSALILDLEERGLLDETLVLCLSEHGRTPKLNKNVGGGRDHWSLAYSTCLAGGGLAKGKLVGQTDAIGGHVRETPISPKDVLATALHLLGIDPNTTVRDQLNRPVAIAGEGVVRPELLA